MTPKEGRTRVVAGDVVVIGGAALMVYGAWLAWEPAGFLLGGIAAIILAIAGGR